MECNIKIDMDNDAFIPDYKPELARILDGLVKKLRDNDVEWRQIQLSDINGHPVGEMVIRG